jgi:pimeloyl-ACP methyl ester carboxylesterase
VVFDSGWEDWAPAWSVVQPKVAMWTRACAYDRAGVGFSSPGPMPRTSLRIAEELHSALKAGGIPGPYILVGHAFGSDNVRTFAELYMPDVAAIVLVDGDVMDLESKESSDKDHSGHARAIAELGQCKDLVALGKPLPRLAEGGGAPRSCAQQFFRGIPEASWSAELNASVLKVAETKVALYEAFMSEMQFMPADEDYLQQHHMSYGSRPLRAITTGKHGVHENDATLSEGQRRYASDAQTAQARWLSRSSRGREVPADSSEYVQFDRPEVVVDTLHEVYELVRH